MTTKAFYHPRSVVVDLADLTRDLYDEIASLHGQIAPPPADPVLTCLGNGQPMYVWRHPTRRYFVRHYANGNTDGHGGHGAISTMSDEHRRQAEYSQRAAAAYGFDARLEVSTGNGTRVDVGVFADLGNVGLEIQRSQLTIPQAKHRTTRSFEAGFPTAWVSDREEDPAWMDHVPTARLTSRGGWDVAVPEPNTAYVSISTFTRERDHGKKSGWRYVREPKSVLLDELAYLMPAGDIVPVAVGTLGHVVLADRAAADVIDSCTYPGASRWNPVENTDKAVKEAVQYYSRDCHHEPTEAAQAEPPAAKALLEGYFNQVEITPGWWEPEPLVIPRQVVQPMLQCPGCPTMHTKSPCFPGCHRALRVAS
ncbi:MAG: hypothetical protein WCI74_09925 [Actinomycetes bacterium]